MNVEIDSENVSAKYNVKLTTTYLCSNLNLQSYNKIIPRLIIGIVHLELVLETHTFQHKHEESIYFYEFLRNM